MPSELTSIDLLIADLATSFFGPSIRLNPTYIVAFILLGFALFLLRRPKENNFFKWLFPAGIYKHPSHMTDIKLFIINRLISFFGLFKGFAATVTIAAFVFATLTSMFGESTAPAQDGFIPLLVVTLLITLVSDFSVYWLHRLSHEVRFLWPFHRVHHTAEVLTPITTYRKHPVYNLVGILITSVISGTAQGLIIYFLFHEISVLILGSINGAYFLFHILGSNYRHTHITISYGRFFEHIFISPAQHQIHHSIDPKHYNKNYGEIFALWDWAFGTLYISSSDQKLEYGMADQYGNKIPQMHNGAWQSLSEPFGASGRRLITRRKPDVEFKS